MSPAKIAGGLALVAVSLGFVFPQLAQIRFAGALPPLGIVLLMLGIAGTAAGVWISVQGLRSRVSKHMQ